jgi:amino acid adenylation domain-containing protein
MSYLLQQLLTKSAKDYPEKEAVLHKSRSITYEQLETLSNQLAWVLRNRGIERGDRVGIYLNKSIEAVVAIFGILKAGGVYVPLDPGAPVKRVAFIIGNCQMKGLIGTQEKIAGLLENWPEFSPVECLVLTDEQVQEAEWNRSEVKFNHVVSWDEVASFIADSPPSTPLIEDDLAYILYTSGSTGDPKGVMISHRASLTFVNWAWECFQVQASDRVSNHAPLHFDLSIFDIFTTIKAGGTVILFPPELSVFPRNLAKFIAEQHITIWYSVPSVLTRLVLYGKLDSIKFPHLRTILFAGEVFPIKYLRQLMELLPNPKYYNLYGPTETNVCTYYPVEKISPERVDALEIGKACANLEVFAINEQSQIAKPGEVGELCVRGPALMKGYWGIPEKTKKVLTPYPILGGIWEENIYRTGDLVKQREDGNYIYLGRRDNQIKSRGYRIELGEIETVLYSHPEVEELAVLAIPDPEITNAIKAVVAPKEGCELSQSDLESFCAPRIPKYMIPGIIEFRKSLPKTSTGKIDKTLLRQQHIESSEK